MGSKKGKFSHSNDPYPTDDETDSIVEEKENEKPFNLIKKGRVTICYDRFIWDGSIFRSPPKIEQ